MSINMTSVVEFKGGLFSEDIMLFLWNRLEDVTNNRISPDNKPLLFEGIFLGSMKVT